MINVVKKIFSSNYSRSLRNFLQIKTTLSNKPKKIDSTISDFFYWNQDQTNSTKFMLTNLSSHTYPLENENDSVRMLIFDNNGKNIKSLNVTLKPFETLNIFFSDLNITGYGSFFVFHKFSKLNDIFKSTTYLAERGYVGYRQQNGVWNFMHGNKFSNYLDFKNNIQTIEALSFYNIEYMPQVSFNDTREGFIILNNPLKKLINFKVKYYSTNNNLLSSEMVNLHKYQTKIIKLVNSCSYVKVSSKLMLSRPIILKKYKTYFDIFHG